MTKADEIKLLDATIRKFGPDSYLGPWLAEHRDRLVQDITSDLPVDLPLPAQARRDAARLLTEAREQAAALRADAERQATEIRDRADTERAASRRRAAQFLTELATAAERGFLPSRY